MPDDWRHVVYSHLTGIIEAPAIGQATLPDGGGGRLLLALDGAYECFHDYGQEEALADVLQEIAPGRAVRRTLDFTVQWARSYADNVTVRACQVKMSPDPAADPITTPPLLLRAVALDLPLTPTSSFSVAVRRLTD
ncbi:hypothetical protein [Streptomyces sp. NPDC051561]|uniref:hypothetical protein n=1 Tax=Streptomyces sp. NPDC051561 TaxID=3365658 RepID=UPI003797C9D9